jgi:hypothetical protein
MMDVQETKCLQACVREISEILYRNTPEEELTTLAGIEESVRQHMLAEVSPRIGFSCRNGYWHNPEFSKKPKIPSSEGCP